MVQKGDILKLGNEKCVDWALSDFVSEHIAIAEYSKQIIDTINLKIFAYEIWQPSIVNRHVYTVFDKNINQEKPGFFMQTTSIAKKLINQTNKN